MSREQTHSNSNSPRVAASYSVELGFYWQAIAIYAVGILIYIVVKGFLEGKLFDGHIEVRLFDPLVVLLGGFVVGSSLVLFGSWYSKRQVTITESTLLFKNRWRIREFSANDIASITVGKEKIFRIRGSYRLVKIKLKARRRLVRLRPSLFENQDELVCDIIDFRKRNGLTGHTPVK